MNDPKSNQKSKKSPLTRSKITKEQVKKFFPTGGRPPKYRTAEALQKKIAEYFIDCPDTTLVKQKDGTYIELPKPTITGLILYCGFCDRHSFYEYEKKPEFSYTIKKAREFMTMEYEKQLGKNPVGAIFALKNLGWQDQMKYEHTGKDGAPIETNNNTNVVVDLDASTLRKLALNG